MNNKYPIVHVNQSIEETLIAIEKYSLGICLVINESKLIGLVTDGDIRRAIISGLIKSDSVEKIVNKNFFYLNAGSSVEEIQKGLLKYKYIPILDNSKYPVDLASASSYHQIPLAKPALDGNELEYITDCIKNSWISSQGKYVTNFEDKFCEYVGSNYALAVSNGTVALHLALVALGIGPGDEVLVPNLTFAAPVNAILYVGATPILVDVDPDSMCINPELAMASISDRTKAIIVVHLYGHPADMDTIVKFSKINNLKIIEDCAEAIGSKYRDKHVGIFGDIGTFSFYGNKTITTGEGGMLVTNSKKIYDHAKILRDHGMSVEKKYWHNEIGFNYRLTNMQAAIGLAQLERIEYFIERKQFSASEYNKRLRDSKFFKIPKNKLNVINSYWMYSIVLSQDCLHQKEELMNHLSKNHIESRPIFFPIHCMPPYKKYSTSNQSYEVSSYLSKGGLCLPSSPFNSISDINKICKLLNSFFINGY